MQIMQDTPHPQQACGVFSRSTNTRWFFSPLSDLQTQSFGSSVQNISC